MRTDLRHQLFELLDESPKKIFTVRGGDTANAFQVLMEKGRPFFVKEVSSGSPFQAEALGLQKLHCPNGVRVPQVVGWSEKFLVLEWIAFSPPPANFQKTFGEKLAITHLTCRSERYGFCEDHMIGGTPQKNLPEIPQAPGHWADFWWTHRLEPMFLKLKDVELQRLGKNLQPKLRHLLPDPEGAASLLHGDLWSGNRAADQAGNPVMFDPAAYYGHPEADLAMTRMFGGFTKEFYDAYGENFHLEKDWKQRQNLYMLYHVLNHALLFGGSYGLQAKEILHQYL